MMVFFILVKKKMQAQDFAGCSLRAWMFHELVWRDRVNGRATGKPQGVGPEAYLNGTSQGPTPEDARKDDHIRCRSKLFMKHPG